MLLPIFYSTASTLQRKLARQEDTRLQGGNCCYCGAPLTGAPAPDILSKRINTRLFPPNFFKYPVHLHHDHKTDLTIGAAHNVCNAVLWQYHGE